MPVVAQLAWKKLSDPVGYSREAVNALMGRQPEAITESEVDAEIARLISRVEKQP